MARKNEAPRLKDHTNKPCTLKGQGPVKTFNSFDPLAKFDPIAYYAMIMDIANKIAPSKIKKKKMKIPIWINVI